MKFFELKILNYRYPCICETSKFFIKILQKQKIKYKIMKCMDHCFIKNRNGRTF